MESLYQKAKAYFGSMLSGYSFRQLIKETKGINESTMIAPDEIIDPAITITTYYLYDIVANKMGKYSSKFGKFLNKYKTPIILGGRAVDEAIELALNKGMLNISGPHPLGSVKDVLMTGVALYLLKANTNKYKVINSGYWKDAQDR